MTFARRLPEVIGRSSSGYNHRDMKTHPIIMMLGVAMAAGCALPYPEGPEGDTTGDGYRIGTWNLEYLHDNHTRGFPEYLFGGPVYGPRREEDYAELAWVMLQKLDFAILLLNEVNALSGTTGAWGGPLSAELDRLTDHLGNHYAYVVSGSGHPQHLAILWDRNRARVDTVFELCYPEVLVEGEDLFLRDPLVAKFTLTIDGESFNDLVVVALHLASGRTLDRNHDSAMARLVDTLSNLVAAPGGTLTGERDIVLAGDLNFDFFDADREEFVERMDHGSWDVLADGSYPATRLGGVPLAPDSRLDYLICTRAMQGPRALISTTTATVHGDLAEGDFDRFRRVYSDHFPLSVQVRLTPDDD